MLNGAQDYLNNVLPLAAKQKAAYAKREALARKAKGLQ
jgi:hypothetical protein